MSHARRRSSSPSSPLLSSWQRTTLLCLIAVYMGYYFCRTNLSVALPTILRKTNLSKSAFGSVISFGYGSYALGKLINGTLIDVVGSRRILLVCLIGSIICTVIFGSIDDQHASVTKFTVIWSLNRIFQSGGWPSITSLISQWFPPAAHGMTMGIASLSYSLGDAIIRFFLGRVLSEPSATWQYIFYLSAICGSILLLPSILYVHQSPLELGLPDPNRWHSGSVQLQSISSSSARFQDIDGPTLESSSKGHRWSIPFRFVKNVYAPLIRQPKFYLLVCMAPFFTWCREIFNSWIVVFIFESFHVNEGTASIISLAFPLLSALSSLVGGFLIDYIERRNRGRVFFIFVLLTFCTFLFFSTFTHSSSVNSPSDSFPQSHHFRYPSNHTGSLTPIVILVSLSAFFLTAPATFVDGVFIMELFQSVQLVKQGTVVGTIHCAGYIGAIGSGQFVGHVVEMYGWSALFKMMSMAMALCTFLSAVYWWADYESVRKENESYGKVADEVVFDMDEDDD